jgi:hypothetical protein
MYRCYLGDAVYADYDGYHIVLTTEDGISTTNTIFLDEGVTNSLLSYIKQLKEELKYAKRS